jgi:hypothetical protein
MKHRQYDYLGLRGRRRRKGRDEMEEEEVEVVIALTVRRMTIKYHGCGYDEIMKCLVERGW